MIPDTVEKCDVYFSRFSNLTEITIPGSVKKFGGNFQNMDKLETITVEEGVQEISGNSMVSNCSSLETIDLSGKFKIYNPVPAAFDFSRETEKYFSSGWCRDQKGIRII